MFPGCHTSGERKDIVMMIELVLQDLRTARVRILFSCAFLKVSWIFYLSSISVVLFFQECVFFIFFKSSKRDGNRDNIEQTLPEISHKLSAHNQYTVYIHTVADWVSS